MLDAVYSYIQHSTFFKSCSCLHHALKSFLASLIHACMLISKAYFNHLQVYITLSPSSCLQLLCFCLPCWTLNALASYVVRCVFQRPTLCFVLNHVYACAMFLNLFLAAYLDCLAWSACLLLPYCICIMFLHPACMHLFQNQGSAIGRCGSLLAMLDVGDHSVQHPLPV